MNEIEIEHRMIIPVIEADRCEIGSCGPVVMIFDACILIILFMP
jgi:hypothetical protein